MEYALQLYSVYTYMEKDVKDTLRRVAEMGYRKVETAGFYGTSAEDFRTWCDEYGLECPSIHETMDFFGDTEESCAAAIKFLKTIGCKRYIIPYAPIDTKEELDQTIDLMNKYTDILEKEGIEIHFHNHNEELVPNKDGLIPHVEMQKRTRIKFQVDIYWVYRAGMQPFYVLEKLKDRISVIHLRNGDVCHSMPLGKGNLRIPDFVKWANANGVDMVVEHGTEPRYELSEAKECLDFLKSL